MKPLSFLAIVALFSIFIIKDIKKLRKGKTAAAYLIILASAVAIGVLESVGMKLPSLSKIVKDILILMIGPQ